MKYLLCLLLFILPIVHAADFSVGVSPNTVIVGDVAPGEQKIVKFSIFTVSTEPLLIYLEKERGSFDFFSRGYTELMDKFSEERTDAWVDFLANPVEIDTSGNKTADRSWKDISVLLNVPRDAEPGYHIFSIIPRPTLYGEPTAPIGTTIVTVTKVSALFNVAGEARRDGIILDTTAHAYTGSSMTLKTFFKNTGTLTVYTRARNRLFDGSGTLAGEFYSSREYVKPQETKTLETPIFQKIEEGTYRVETTIDITTDELQKNSTIVLVKTAVIAAPPAAVDPLFITVLIIAIIIIIVIAWWFGAKRV